MESLFRLTLFIAGVINLLPSFLAFLPQKIASSYGIDIPDANYELLLRHRAILFGIVGGLMIYSAITKTYYGIAGTAGLISMVSFILLYFLIDHTINDELKKIMMIDVVASIILVSGMVSYWLSIRG
jgi:hypothetical protein